jgi:hypothetical protein
MTIVLSEAGYLLPSPSATPGPAACAVVGDNRRRGKSRLIEAETPVADMPADLEFSYAIQTVALFRGSG